jgi:hypothetical protein
MRRVTLSLVSALAALLVTGVVMSAQAADAWLGTWKLNLAKSTYEPASLAPKSQTTRQTASGDSVTATTDGVDAQGKPLHTVITYKFDGKDYEYKGAPDPKSTRAYTRIGEHNYQFVNKVDGRITTTSRVTVAADGKTRTIITSGRDAEGRVINNLSVWDKQ